jgi:DNA-binding response OmpR family regulator
LNELLTLGQNDKGQVLLEDRILEGAKTAYRVLLVEDDEKLAASLRTGLGLGGNTVVHAGTVDEARNMLERGAFDVVLLDIVLPGKSGLQLLLWMRASRMQTPVLILSARDTVSDRVMGLESGANDYLVKPFAFSELSARIRVLTRHHKPARGRLLRCADLEIDVKTHSARRAGVPLILTFREFEILEYLCNNRGSIVSREMLARDIWKENNRYTPLDNVINVHITHLRQKIDGNSSRKLLHTVRRVGFILRDKAA